MTQDRDRAFLRALADDDCKAILQATREEARTVPELSDECDIPLSTAYRKVDLLQRADLLAEKNRISSECKPKNAYEQSFEAAVVTMNGDGEFEVELATTPLDSLPADPGSDAPLSFAGSD